MTDESYSFSTARVRLEEIVSQVRKKDTSLEKSLDLLEEGVRLANACTELIDHADWTVGGVGEAEGDAATSEGAADVTAEGGEAADGSHVAAESAEPEARDAAAGDPAEADAAVEADAEFASDDDAFGDAADEAWADDTPEFRDDEGVEA